MVLRQKVLGALGVWTPEFRHTVFGKMFFFSCIYFPFESIRRTICVLCMSSVGVGGVRRAIRVADRGGAQRG